jgi:putative transposase
MKEAKRKPSPSDLTYAQWEFIKPLLLPPAATGRPRADEREIINGSLYALTTGCSREYLPHDIKATWQTCHRYLPEYQRRRVWPKIVRELMRLA